MCTAIRGIECLHMHVTLYMQGKHVKHSCSYSHLKTLSSKTVPSMMSSRHCLAAGLFLQCLSLIQVCKHAYLHVCIHMQLQSKISGSLIHISCTGYSKPRPVIA